jgi:hypothetical protein
MERPHWDYYLSITEDLEKATRYVAFEPENFQTFSIEFVRILLAAGSEIDVVAKLLCAQIKPQEAPENIDAYRNIISTHYPKFCTIEINARKHGLAFKPWEAWGNGQNPQWWRVYNKVKHRRNVHFKDATLENALLAVSALCVLLGYLYSEFFASKVVVIQRPLLFFDSQYQFGGPLLTVSRFKLP